MWFCPGKGRWRGRRREKGGRWILLGTCQSRNRLLCLGFLEEKEGREVDEGVGGVTTSFSSFPLLPDLSLLLFLTVMEGCCRCVHGARQLAHSLFFQAFVFFFITFLQLWLVFMWNLKQVVCWLDTSLHNKHEADSVCLWLSLVVCQSCIKATDLPLWKLPEYSH